MGSRTHIRVRIGLVDAGICGSNEQRGYQHSSDKQWEEVSHEFLLFSKEHDKPKEEDQGCTCNQLQAARCGHME